MDFNFTPDQLDLKKMAQELVAKEITPYVHEMDEKNEMRPGLIRKFYEAGILNLVVPEEYDGPGLDALSIALIYEELGKGCAGVATSAAANALASYPVLVSGNDAQKRKMFDALNEGKLAAFALTEPNAGSDAGGVSTSAVKDGEYYVLNGTKCFITNGGISDVYTIFANADVTADKVKKVLEVIAASKDAMAQTQLLFNGLEVERMHGKIGVPYHDGALAYFRDQAITETQ